MMLVWRHFQITAFRDKTVFGNSDDTGADTAVNGETVTNVP